MPDWFAPLLAGIALFGFMAFAFWRSRKVKPDSHNQDGTLPGAGSD